MSDINSNERSAPARNRSKDFALEIEGLLQVPSTDKQLQDAVYGDLVSLRSHNPNYKHDLEKANAELKADGFPMHFELTEPSRDAVSKELDDYFHSWLLQITHHTAGSHEQLPAEGSIHAEHFADAQPVEDFLKSFWKGFSSAVDPITPFINEHFGRGDKK